MIDSFVGAVDAVAPGTDARPVARDLHRRWRQEGRGYHDERHLSEMLGRLDELGHHDPTCVLAAWYHDAVYTGHPGDDERASAELAVRDLTGLGASHRWVRQVRDLVLVTITHRPGDDPHEQAVVDADMAILAASPGRYAEYLAGVRTDFARYDDATFAAGRRAFVEEALSRPWLFHTAYGRDRWESAARRNLAAERG